MSANDPSELEKIPGIGPKRAQALRVAGYETLADLTAATEEELREVEMFDDVLARDIKATVSSDLNDPVEISLPNHVTPREWRVTEGQRRHIEQIADVSLDLDTTSALDLRDRLEWVLDPPLLGFRQVCGKVVTYDEATGEHRPVPNATVHVEDTDCSFLSYFPSGLDYGWLFPYGCTREKIATVTTDECGEFCVFVPRWDIDRVLDFRRERVCLPDMYRPRLRDILENPRVLPDPVLPPRPVPEPRPDPGPLPLLDPGVYERTVELVGETTVNEIQARTLERSFGEPGGKLQDLLDRPAFPTRPEPPLPPGFRDIDERIERVAEELPVDTDVLEQIDPEGYLGPYLRCRDVLVPEWRTFTDVPDITFRVTQDVDRDGTEEEIYSEGYFDVRWDRAGDMNVELIADDDALSTPPCEGLTPVNFECGDQPSLESIGMMPARSPYYDDETGYALRMNRPKPDPVSPSGRPDGTAPFAGTLQFHGCHRYEEAEYYRVHYQYEGGSTKTFTGQEWYVPAVGRLPVHVEPAGSGGWYPVLDIDYLESYYGEMLRDNPLVFPFLFLNWNTRGYRDGKYDVWIELGDSDMEPLGDTSPKYSIEIDNTPPNLDITRLVWGPLSEDPEDWNNDITERCPKIERQEGTGIGIRVEFRAWSEHFRSVHVTSTGCNQNPTLHDSMDRSGNTYSYWHESVSDRSTTQTVDYKIPASYDQGGYRLHLRGVSRAFNPAGSGLGPSSDWDTDPGYLDSHFNRLIAVVDK